MKKAYGLVVIWTHNPLPYGTIDLFFSSTDKIEEKWPGALIDHQIVAIEVPDDFEDWDYVPENY